MRTTNAKTIALWLGALSLAAGCSSDAMTGPTETTAVRIVDDRFSPQANAIVAGETVTWTWTGSNLHNVTFDDASIGNSATQADGTFSKAFPTAGEYTYFCTVHGRAVMSGRVVVTSPSSAGGRGAGG